MQYGDTELIDRGDYCEMSANSLLTKEEICEIIQLLATANQPHMMRVISTSLILNDMPQ